MSAGLNKILNSVEGQTMIDPREYLAELKKQKTYESDTYEKNRIRLSLKLEREKNSHNASLWITSIQEEEKGIRSRKRDTYICGQCGHSFNEIDHFYEHQEGEAQPCSQKEVPLYLSWLRENDIITTEENIILGRKYKQFCRLYLDKINTIMAVKRKGKRKMQNNSESDSENKRLKLRNNNDVTDITIIEKDNSSETSSQENNSDDMYTLAPLSKMDLCQTPKRIRKRPIKNIRIKSGFKYKKRSRQNESSENKNSFKTSLHNNRNNESQFFITKWLQRLFGWLTKL
ncbi:Protein STABILIZED1 [Formica fusca]